METARTIKSKLIEGSAQNDFLCFFTGCGWMRVVVCGRVLLGVVAWVCFVVGACGSVNVYVLGGWVIVQLL